MPPRSSLWVLALALFGFLQVIRVEASGHRTIHRLIGGHLNSSPDLDDVELIITSSAGAGRESNKKVQDDAGGDVKTLSQQVADGKYGLIQKELFNKPVKRPGVLSYENNPEVPKDNSHNLGGLNKDDIWLAENHLLVIKGGSYPAHDSHSDNIQPIWIPIDDYKAPSRQVKIPKNPKVPPPFPVQLTDGGPLQILGTNTTTTLNGSFAASPQPLPPPEGGYFPGIYPPSGEGQYPTNATSGETPFPIPPFPPTGDYGPPLPPFAINGSLPPFFASLPPGAAILPPPGNITDLYDEDDPSIYYPPPYSFHYQMDNSTQVPPGPLVPGIVLPPPPNFFAPLEKPRKKPSTVKPKPTRPPTTKTTTTTTELIKQIYATTTPLPPTSVNNQIQRLKPAVFKQTTKTPTRVVTVYPVKYHTTSVPQRNHDRRKRPPTVTILRPVKLNQTKSSTTTTTTTQRPVYFYETNEVHGKPFKVYGPPTRSRTVISSTQIPLKAYITTNNEIESNLVTQSPQRKTTKPPAQYYFYEEEAVTNSITTQKPIYYLPEKQPKTQYLPEQQQQQIYRQPHLYQQPPVQQRPKQQFYYVNNRPTRPSRYRFIETTKKPDTFSVHVARLKQQIHQYYTTPDPYSNYDSRTQAHHSPKPVYQFSFQAANYQEQHNYPQQANYPQQSNYQSQQTNYQSQQENYRSQQANYPQQQQQQQQQSNYQQQQTAFRASPVDDAKYSVEVQPAIEVHPTQAPVYQNTPSPVYYQEKPSTTKRPRYYSSTPDYDYEDRYVATPRPISQYSFQATPNPAYQPYYTKQEERYFDDITKKYFTIFGKKIPAATTPLSNIEVTSPRYLPQQQQQQQQQQQHYIHQEPTSLHSDINVNYKRARPPVNSEAEIVEAIPVKISAESGKQPGSFISYELPGDDGAHFYFLTPQLAQSREQGAGFYYENPNAPRVRRSDSEKDEKDKPPPTL